MTKNLRFFAMIAVLLVAITACSKEEGAEVIVPQPEQENSFRVSVGDALRSAEAILNSGDRATRSVERKVKSTETYVAKPATRSNDDVEVSFYLINYEDNAGYALVSTDKRATPVYMYADEGNITTEAFEEVPPMAIFMEEAVANYEAEVASSGIDGPIDITPPPGIDGHIGRYNGEECYVTIEETVEMKGPYCATRWHQAPPYNHYCNDHYVGCGIVAMGQIMAYYQYPSSHNAYTFDWDLMTSQPSYTSVDVAGALDVALFLRQIGDEAEADYTDSEASTDMDTADFSPTLRSFGYNAGNIEFFSSDLAKIEINYNRPIIVWGRNDSDEGHAWVIDGYESHITTTRYNELEAPYALIHSESTEVFYLSHNIGGSGNSYWNYQFTALDVYHNNVGMVRQIYPINQ